MLDVYATVDDLIDRFGEAEMIGLTDPDNTAVQSARAQRKLDDAHALANGYVGMAYRLPLAGCAKPAPQPGNPQAVETVAPPLLARLVCDIARYYLYDDKSTEEVLKRYEQAKQELLHISQGKATLACPWGGVAGEPLSADPQAGGGEVGYSFPQRQMTDDTLRGFA